MKRLIVVLLFLLLLIQNIGLAFQSSGVASCDNVCKSMGAEGAACADWGSQCPTGYYSTGSIYGCKAYFWFLSASVPCCCKSSTTTTTTITTKPPNITNTTTTTTTTTTKPYNITNTTTTKPISFPECTNHADCSQACTTLCPKSVYGCCYGCKIGQCINGKCQCIDAPSYCSSPNYQVGSKCTPTRVVGEIFMNFWDFIKNLLGIK